MRRRRKLLIGERFTIAMVIIAGIWSLTDMVRDVIGLFR